MTLLRMLAFRPADAPPAQASPAAAPRQRPTQAPPKAPKAKPDVAAPEQAASQPSMQISESAAEKVSTGAGQPPVQAAAIEADLDWSQLAGQLDVGGMAGQLAMHCDWGGRSEGRIKLLLDPNHGHLGRENVVKRLEEALAEHFGVELQLQIELAVPQRETPAVRVEQEQQARQQQAVESIESDPNVAAMREMFGAEVVTGSIKPIQ